MNGCGAQRPAPLWFGAGLLAAIACADLALSVVPSVSQAVDCRELAARIAALGDGGQRYSRHYGDGAVQKRRAELDRTIRYARSLGCNRQFSFFEAPPPQCPGLNAQIGEMQASLAQEGADSPPDPARQRLIASYNAYCRGQAPASQPREHGFFESLFGALNLNLRPLFPPGPPRGIDGPPPPMEQVVPQPGEDLTPRGGSQALCVRSCDGGFFPLSVSARQADPAGLANLCQALCPNAEVSVYTRSPSQDIMSAVSLDGGIPYSELPNAEKFRKTFDPACTCKPPGQSWAEALAGAEEFLGRVSGDIVVTPEKSAELAKPKLEKAKPPQAVQPPAADTDHAHANPAGTNGQSTTEEVTGPDGVKRRVRIIVPPL